MSKAQHLLRLPTLHRQERRRLCRPRPRPSDRFQHFHQGRASRAAHSKGRGQRITRMSTFVQQLINGISLGAIYSLIALGYTMVYGVLKLINFAHGDVYMVGAFMGFYMANGIGVKGAQMLGLAGDGIVARGLLGDGVMQPSLITAMVIMLLAMAICAALGVIIERLAYRPVRKYSRLTALITAIGVSLLLENGGQVVFGAEPKFFPELFTKRNINLFEGASINSADIVVLVIAMLLMIALQLIVYRTKTGRAMRAVSF